MNTVADASWVPSYCPKCGGKKFGLLYVAAQKVGKYFFGWLTIPAVVEHLRLICGCCGYTFIKEIGAFRVTDS